MRASKALLILSLAAASVIAATVATSAADVNGTLAIVNGFPGKKVDVCLNGREIASGLPYGRRVLKANVATGTKVIDFFVPDPRTCRGTRRAKIEFVLPPAGDRTIVVTKDAPRVLAFDNADLGEIPPLGSPSDVAYIVWRNASDMLVNFRIKGWLPSIESPTSPAADPVFAKGQQRGGDQIADYIWQVRATLSDTQETLALRRALLVASHRYEWVLVGSNPGNARFVFIDRVVSLPSP